MAARPNRKTRRPRKARSAPKRMPRRMEAPTNTGNVKECYQLAIPDGAVAFLRNIQLADVIYDRAQAVAQAYQQFRIKYVKLTFRPSADTFPAVPGNIIPQLYFMKDLANAIPTNADANTFFSMGARPRRMDDKNLVYTWKPSVLTADKTDAAVAVASQIRISPWLSTNANSGNPGAAWAPSGVDHLGCAFYVTKINPADTLQYTIDIEVVFQFRKPVWKGGDSQETHNLTIKGDQLVTLGPTV